MSGRSQGELELGGTGQTKYTMLLSNLIAYLKQLRTYKKKKKIVPIDGSATEFGWICGTSSIGSCWAGGRAITGSTGATVRAVMMRSLLKVVQSV